MITAPDFSKKQIVFVLFNEGEKMAFSNSNLVVKDIEGKVKFQVTCYRLFLVFAVGHCSLTSAIIQEAKKFGFFIALMTPGFRLYAMVGAEKEGNTLLHKKQYLYSGLELAKHITQNKILNQLAQLKMARNKSEAVKESIERINEYLYAVKETASLNEIMAYEGLASKVYFRNHFNNVIWQGRQPRIKRDYVNSALDVGYTLLFTYIDALLSSFGFDTYCGVMHRQFYMRKSLVCDLVEPFRPIIDHAVKKGINLRQISQDDFIEINHQYRLKWNESSKYVKIFMMPIIEEKEAVFLYIQSYYRAFMKDLPAKKFPVYEYGEI
ncbi:MAG: type V CRISPR-associated endonuclease Cas1 [Clostridiales bacterium]|nr:type V CRISPR-associated endonuclease Cas1 [Clostridiales bacterium]